MKSSEKKRNTIMSAAVRNGIDSVNILADMTYISRSTLHRKLKAPETLTIAEIRQIDHKVHFTDDEVKVLIRG